MIGAGTYDAGVRQKAIARGNVDPDLFRHMVSLGHDVLISLVLFFYPSEYTHFNH